MNIIESRTELVKKIKSISGRGKTLRADISIAAGSCWAHAAESGDLTLASRLHNSVPNSFKADLKRYFAAFAPVRWDKKSQQFLKLKKGGAFDPAALETEFDNLDNTPSAAPEYDQDKAIANIIKAMVKVRDNAEESGDASTAARFEVLINELKPAELKAAA